METYFISDIHIKDINERNGVILLRFLNFLAEKKKAEQVRLFLLGDIFDLWILDGEAFVKKYRPLVDAIRRLKEKGAQITFFEGNHDVHMAGFWTQRLGIEVHVEAQYYKIDNLTIRLEHGDLMNPHDEAYLKYRAVIRNPYVVQLGRLVPGEIWNWAGMKASQKSRYRTGTRSEEKNARIVQTIRNHVPKAYAEKPFDLIISGHMHVFDDCDINIAGRSVRSINLGSWLETPNTLVIKDSQLTWIKGTEFMNLIS